MSDMNVTEIKSLNGFPLVDTKAREDIAKLTEEIAVVKTAIGDESSSMATATGDRLLIRDCVGGAFGGLSIYGATYQAVTPSESNPQVLQSIGMSGEICLNVSNKNLINRPYVGGDSGLTRGGVAWTVNADGSITASGSNISGSPWGADFRLWDYDKWFACWGSQVEASLGDGGTDTSSEMKVSARDCTFQHARTSSPFVYINAPENVAISRTLYPQVEFGNTVTEFEAPVSAQYVTVSTPNSLCGVPVTSGGVYVDANGISWVCDEINFTRGVRIQRIGQIASYAGEKIATPYISSTGSLSAGANVHYVLPEPVTTTLDDAVMTSYRALKMHSPNTSVYVTYDISAMSGPILNSAPTVKVTYTKKEISNNEADNGAKNDFDPNAYGLPMLYLAGDTALMTKDNAVTLNYVYGDLYGTCTCKWQGSSSLSWEKKNYTIKFDNAFEVVDGWGKQKKYCFKANFIDHSHARNVVNAKLWGQIVKSRANANEVLNALPNAGAVDGFPCIIMLNGEFHGLYTWNIPKDGWMFGMNDSTKQQAILCADTQNDACGFKAVATLTDDFELEYVADENNADWILASLNRLINACINSDGSDIDTTIAQYLDWDSVIDYHIFTALLGGNDMVRKNYLLVTYDGTKWFFSAYDMDTTYGLNWKGDGFDSSRAYPTITDYSHIAMRLVLAHKKDVLKARYTKLRKTALSEDNLYLMFSNWAAAIPRTVFEEDARKWPTIPSTAVNNTAQILNWYRLRCAVIDKDIESL